jgi:glycolate oxidase FAD binding subunit
MSTRTDSVVARLESLVDPGARITEPEKLNGYAIGSALPEVALQPSSTQEIVDIVKFAAAENLAIVPCGARTKLDMGLPPRKYDIALDLTRMDRIVAYDPDDLTLSLEPGIFLRNLHQELGKHSQALPIGAPFMTRATVGGTIASGVDNPMRQFYGTARDFILGMEFVTGDGVLGKSGGLVVKNVTGYDLHKPMIGSLGTLAILTKINFRTFPAPQSIRGFTAFFANVQEAAACRDAVASSPLRPLLFEILSPGAAKLLESSGGTTFPGAPNVPPGILSTGSWTVVTCFAGGEPVLARCEAELRRLAEDCGASAFARIAANGAVPELAQAGAIFWRLREFVPIALEASPACTIAKISVPPEQIDHALAAVHHAADDHSLPWAAMARGVGVIYAAFLPSARDEHAMKCVLEATNRIHSDSDRLGGHATIPWCPDEWKQSLNIWGPQNNDLPLMKKLKSVFDPRGILAPGRFVGGI